MSTTLDCSLEREQDFSVAPSAFAVEEAWKRLEADLLAGFNSGVLPPVTPEYWDAKRAALRAKQLCSPFQ
ncbi:MAG: hypothetical protein ACRC46_13245 [Thermoguttaceae bacterium]